MSDWQGVWHEGSTTKTKLSRRAACAVGATRIVVYRSGVVGNGIRTHRSNVRHFICVGAASRPTERTEDRRACRRAEHHPVCLPQEEGGGAVTKVRTPPLLILAVVIFLLSGPGAHAQAIRGTSMRCEQWTIRIDPGLGDAGVPLASVLSDQEVIATIDCLLRLQDDRRPARFGGATRRNVSQILPTATIELAALYYISYLYYDHWQDADGVALRTRKGVFNPPGSTATAYAAYGKWFERVKSIGIAAARARHLDPLHGTGLRWYGK